jgi:hypothetical protein
LIIHIFEVGIPFPPNFRASSFMPEKEETKGGSRPIRALKDVFPDYGSRKDVGLGVR